MSELVESNSQPLLEPIICDVKTPIKRTVWGKSNQNIANQGEVLLDVEKGNQIKKILLASAIYQEIKIPHRFTLISCEIVYQNKHIKAVRLAGLYLSGIDPAKVEAQLSTWKTEPPPETFLDDNDEIVMSEKFGQQCHFTAHRKGEDFHIAWNLTENFDICQNPQNYSSIQGCVVDFTK